MCDTRTFECLVHCPRKFSTQDIWLVKCTLQQFLVLIFIRLKWFLQNLKDTNQYVQNEMETLEREQQQIDRRATKLEKELRKVMEKGENILYHF